MKSKIIALCVLAAINVTAQTKNDKLYPFKTAVVEYTYEGNTTGHQNLFIDNYGKMQCEETHTVSKSFGQKSEENSVKISMGLDIYQWDTNTKIGTKIHNQLAEDLMNDPDFDPEEFGKRTMESLGYSKAGNETVNGKLCEVWKGLAGTSTIWIWNSLSVKSEIKMLGTKTTWTANVIKINEGIPAGKFNVPLDIEFEDMGTTDPVEMMNRGMKQAEEEAGQDSNTEIAPEENPIDQLKGLMKKIK